ncbi:MAG: hydroxymethylglutaryl-CoA lyase [Granulosicoccus sp.]
MNYPTEACLVEVGPRDGLQNEAAALTVEQKSSLVNHLSETGLKVIETGSFVSPRWVPQMADSKAVFNAINRRDNVRYSALTPNLKGLEDAIAANVSEVAVFVAVTESFSKKNLNASIAETFDRYQPVLDMAADKQLPVRGYLSCVLGCPYEGEVDPHVVRDLTLQLLEAGCYEISLGDTIGTGNAGSMTRLLEVILGSGVSAHQLAVHCHDTYGQALANIVVALQHGVATIDSSIAGLGGCPYAVGATGNVATEDVVYLLDGLGIEHGVQLDTLLKASQYICAELGRESQSRAGRALSLKG